jgi:hypothetical protein
VGLSDRIIKKYQGTLTLDTKIEIWHVLHWEINWQKWFGKRNKMRVNIDKYTQTTNRRHLFWQTWESSRTCCYRLQSAYGLSWHRG